MTSPISTQKAPVLTVSQLTNAIKLSLETTFPMISLQGEVSNFKVQSSGHLYFCLKDANAQINAVMFRGDAASLNPLPKEGDQVIVRGEINVYPPRGYYQIVIRDLSYVGVGELLLKLEQLKIKLHKMGWFSKERKKPLPPMPRTIGVVTSPTGAAIQDILNILTRRFSGFRLILNPVRVQGVEAPREIAQAIEQFNQYQLADVLIVGRGGGSIEDLWAFNEEIVAQAIYNSKIPIISAVGHETDHCIADYVADVRAPTPSAAAEIVIAEKNHLQQQLEQFRRRLWQSSNALIRQHRQQLSAFAKHPYLASPYAIVGAYMQKVDDLREQIERAMQQKLQTISLKLHSLKQQLNALKPTIKLKHYKERLLQLEKSLITAWTSRQNVRRKQFNAELFHKKIGQLWFQMQHLRHERLKYLEDKLKTIDPKSLLKRGYSILFSEKDRSVISSVHQLQVNNSVQIMLSDGEAISTIKEIIIP